MKTGSQIQKEAEAESVKCLGEVSKDFIIGYLSSWIAITENGGIYKKGFSDGYDAGFTCAEIACNCNITEAQNQYDQDITPAPSSDLANIHAGVPGPSYNPIVSELQQIICGSLKPKP